MNEKTPVSVRKLCISMPADLVDRIDRVAKNEGRTRSNAIAALVRRAVAEQLADPPAAEYHTRKHPGAKP
jgi:metal-responsive CopG/Arc/MetJ family transcriptional regulator